MRHNASIRRIQVCYTNASRIQDCLPIQTKFVCRQMGHKLILWCDWYFGKKLVKNLIFLTCHDMIPFVAVIKDRPKLTKTQSKIDWNDLDCPLWRSINCFIARLPKLSQLMSCNKLRRNNSKYDTKFQWNIKKSKCSCSFLPVMCLNSKMCNYLYTVVYW